MRRVIFLDPPRVDVDVTSAELHGERVDLYAPIRRGPGHSGSASRPTRPSVMDFEHFTQDVLEKLSQIGFDPEVDAIVATGAQLTLSLAFAALAVAYKRFKVLAFASNQNAYVVKDYDASWAAMSGATTGGQS